MPWRPHYSKSQAEQAIRDAVSWVEVLDALGYVYHGKNIRTVRKWSEHWGISVEHLPSHGTRRLCYTEAEARAAIAESQSWAEALRKLGYCPTGANPRTLKKRAAEWGISVQHFDSRAAQLRGITHEAKPLDEILVKGSTYSRSNLKRRLYEEGLKQRRCELCGQDELWRGKQMGLILDHINGVRDDNRIENLRIVCPNCAATLDTHCGRRNRLPVSPRRCLRCEAEFMPRSPSQRYCSRACGTRWRRKLGQAAPVRRTVSRPPRDRLLAEIDELGYSAVGRKYGVSDNAVRKWVRQYERERALAEGRDADVVEIPRRTWPNRRRDRDAA